jgi:hypothetical protein
MDNYKIGFDFYFYPMGDESDDDWNKAIIEEIRLQATKSSSLAAFPFARAARVRNYWTMRGRAGRSRATWLLAGVTAAALAQLTDGFLWSDDGGADYERMPTSHDTFMSWFPKWIWDEFLP